MLLPVPGLVQAHASGPAPGPVVPRLCTQLGPLPMRSTKGTTPPPQPLQRARSTVVDDNGNKEEG